MPVSATAVPCLSDNYAWLLRDAATGATAICDPGEAAPIIAALEAAGGRCDLILLTHHHGDHIAGVEEVKARFGSKVVGAAADAHRLPPLDHKVGLSAMDLLSGKKLQGVLMGSNRFPVDIPRLVDFYLRGLLDLDSIVAETIPLEQINDGFEKMKKGDAARSVIVFS